MKTETPQAHIYYSVIIPFVAKGATEWHPTDRNFAPLSRGAFPTQAAARMWAQEHLRHGQSFTLRAYEGA